MTTTHILIVEDEVLLAQNITRFLKRIGFCARFVANVADAVQTLQQQTIDIVLLDIELPDGNGFDAYSQMRQLMPQLQGIVMTGRPLPQHRQRAQQLAIQDFLVKPFALSALQQRLQALGARPAPDTLRQAHPTSVANSSPALLLPSLQECSAL